MQVFNVAPAWRGRMKRIAREIIRHRFASELMVDFSGNQLEVQEGVQRNIKALLQDAVYLRGRKDAQVSTVTLSPYVVLLSFALGSHQELRTCCYQGAMHPILLQQTRGHWAYLF
jgi:hypothetical protein